jgi:hypothetical protein
MRLSRSFRMLMVVGWIVAGAVLAIPASAAGPADGPADGPIYELRIYPCEPGKLAPLNKRFREYTMKIFARHGIENVAYWVPEDDSEMANSLVYLLRHKNREAASESWAAFRADPEWKQIAKQWSEEYGKLLSKSPDVTYLEPTDYSPETGFAKPDRLYELRIYTAAEGKLDALHDRFRKHTDKIFAKHGMRAIGYWRPMDAPKSKNIMIYVLEHKDADSAAASWKAFAADPDWQAAKASTEADGKLTAVRPQRGYMKPTDYSPTE